MASYWLCLLGITVHVGIERLLGNPSIPLFPFSRRYNAWVCKCLYIIDCVCYCCIVLCRVTCSCVVCWHATMVDRLFLCVSQSLIEITLSLTRLVIINWAHCLRFCSKWRDKTGRFHGKGKTKTTVQNVHWYWKNVETPWIRIRKLHQWLKCNDEQELCHRTWPMPPKGALTT